MPISTLDPSFSNNFDLEENLNLAEITMSGPETDIAKQTSVMKLKKGDTSRPRFTTVCSCFSD